MNNIYLDRLGAEITQEKFKEADTQAHQRVCFCLPDGRLIHILAERTELVSHLYSIIISKFGVKRASFRLVGRH